MLRRRSSAAVLLFLFCISLGAGAAEGPPDPYMGDWEGSWTNTHGEKSAIVAQVIALGDGEYAANLLERFDARDVDISKLTGRLEDGEVVLTGVALPKDYAGTHISVTIDEESLKGVVEGGPGGSFTMSKTVRLSPTMGREAPEGAVVLLDGSSLDAWRHPPRPLWIFDLHKILGKNENCVGYLQCRVMSPRAQDALLEMGSDDGAKVWVNDKEVYKHDKMRGLAPGADKIPVHLAKGENRVLLKVMQGGGGWGACARLRTPDGKAAADVDVLRPEGVPDVLAMARELPENPYGDYIVYWEAAGPFRSGEKKPEELLEMAFAPEKGRAGASGADDAAKWASVAVEKPGPSPCQWLLLDDGAMEVKAGTGSIVSRSEFGDMRMHLEFRTPLMAKARGQGRGNSGVYFQGRYEVQILDSYGLVGADNECGGIYQVARPRVNMCAPPLQWQTYDVTFRAPRFDASGVKTEDAVITVVHNGVPIHTDLKVPGPTGGNIGGDVRKPAGVLLQDHGNPVQFRNIWVEELD